MKKFVLIICGLIILASCQNREDKISKVAADTANYTEMQWIDSVKKIGVVNAGTKTEIKFRFKNTGTKPLFIIAAHPGCGCTIADYPEEAIAPNAEGVITADFNVPKTGQGEFRKNISVTANTKGSTYHNIFFYGEIKKDTVSPAAKK
jgi:hypothetical protein